MSTRLGGQLDPRPRTLNTDRGARVPGEPGGRSAAADTHHGRPRPGLASPRRMRHSPSFLFGTEALSSGVTPGLLGPADGLRAVCIADAGGWIKCFPFLQSGGKTVRGLRGDEHYRADWNGELSRLLLPRSGAAAELGNTKHHNVHYLTGFIFLFVFFSFYYIFSLFCIWMPANCTHICSRFCEKERNRNFVKKQTKKHVRIQCFYCVIHFWKYYFTE